jgi:hypothetical protein
MATEWHPDYSFIAGWALEGAGEGGLCPWVTAPVSPAIGGEAAPTNWLACLQDTIRRNDVQVPYDHAQYSPDLGPTVTKQGYPTGEFACYLAPPGSFGTILEELLSWAFGPADAATVRPTATLFGYGDALLNHAVSGMVTTRASLAWRSENGPGGLVKLSTSVIGYDELMDGTMTAVPEAPTRPDYDGEAPLDYQTQTILWDATPVTADVTAVEFAVEWAIPVDQLQRAGQPQLGDARRFTGRSATLTLDMVPGDAIGSSDIHTLKGSADPWTLSVGASGGAGISIALARVEVPRQLAGYEGRGDKLLPFQLVGKCLASEHGAVDAFAVTVTA